VRRLLLAVVVLAACGDAEEHSCVHDADCDAGARCRGGVCLRYQLPPGTPWDPHDASLDAGSDVVAMDR
jgi:hypothetical protein